jgi:hypothetical protein
VHTKGSYDDRSLEKQVMVLGVGLLGLSLGFCRQAFHVLLKEVGIEMYESLI